MRALSKISERTLNELARMVGLDLSSERVRLLAPLFREFLEDLKEMDRLDLGEEPLNLVPRIRRERDESPERTQ